MWDLDHKEGWGQKNWCFRTVVLEKSLEGPLDSKEIKLVSPKENQPWIFIWRTGAEAEAPIPWPPDVKSWLTEKDPDAGEDWGQEEKGATEDEMVGRHRWLNAHEFEQLREMVKDRETWRAAAHGVERSQTGLSEWTRFPQLYCSSHAHNVHCHFFMFFFFPCMWSWPHSSCVYTIRKNFQNQVPSGLI